MRTFFFVILLAALAWFLWPVDFGLLPPPTISIPGDYRPSERWACRAQTYSRSPGKDLVRIDGDLSANIGTVDLLNSTAGPQPTDFTIDGLDRRWNWCPESGGAYMCAFVIDPEGDGRYYKFNQDESKTIPSGLFECRQMEGVQA